MLHIIVFSILASGLASSMLTYIALATPIGPWIEPVFVLALIGVFAFLKFFGLKFKDQNETITCVAVSAGVAGMASVACAFTLPTLFFLDPKLVKNILDTPEYFIGIIIGLVLVTGLISFVFVSILEKFFLENDELTFPEVQLTHRIMTAEKNNFNLFQFFIGSFISIFLGFLQIFRKSFPKVISLFKGFSYKILHVPNVIVRIDVAPMMIALGFVTGHIVAIPLIVGSLTKIFFVEPFQKVFFNFSNKEQVLVAFCTGLILFSVINSFVKIFISFFSKVKKKNLNLKLPKGLNLTLSTTLLCFFALLIFLTFFGYFNFSSISLIYLICFAMLCVFELALIASKVGLAPLGRFATFVMLPGLMLFGYNHTQATLVAAFVELCGGMSVDMLFGRKLMQLTTTKKSNIITAQITGIIVAAIVIGLLFWQLGGYELIGTPPLIAQRAYTRSLLITAHNFDPSIILVGMFAGLIYKFFNINIVLILTGLLMPLEYILPLILGGLLGLFSKKREKYYPFWAGIFATTSIFLIFSILFLN